MKALKLQMKKAKPMAPSNMSIQTTGAPSYMDRPSMKQDDHSEHNMPTSDYDGVQTGIIVAPPIPEESRKSNEDYANKRIKEREDK